MPKLLNELYALQEKMAGQLDPDEALLLKMCANLLESHYEVKEPRNRLTEDEYFRVPGRFEMSDGMLLDY